MSDRPRPPHETADGTSNDTEGLPARFGRYTLVRRLARGGMAELFLAVHRSDAGFEKLLVIKRLLPSISRDKTFTDMLVHEARIAATLSHPNLVQVFDTGRHDGQFYVVMEHVHGADLRAVIRQMKKKSVLVFPVEHAIAIALGTCAGLAHAHDRRDLHGKPLGIVHRDISPQNVMLTFDGDVKIVDFGIAKSNADGVEETRSGTLKGKVAYMSPEQARGEPLDARSDLFAVGTMLFELTTGKRLFKGQSEYETLRLICDREYPKPSEICPDYPPELERIVMRALAKERSARYQDARELQADLEEYVRSGRVAVSRLALARFMRSLFDEELARESERPIHVSREPPDEKRSDEKKSDERKSVAKKTDEKRAGRFASLTILGGVLVAGTALGGVAYALATKREPPGDDLGGTLDVRASGIACEVTIDGRPRGTTPLAGVALAAGPHRVTCATPEGDVRTATVEVDPGRTAHHEFDTAPRRP